MRLIQIVIKGFAIIRPHPMHDVRTIAIDDPVACLLRGWLFVFIRQMSKIRRSHYYIAVATCYTML